MSAAQAISDILQDVADRRGHPLLEAPPAGTPCPYGRCSADPSTHRVVLRDHDGHPMSNCQEDEPLCATCLSWVRRILGCHCTDLTANGCCRAARWFRVDPLTDPAPEPRSSHHP